MVDMMAGGQMNGLFCQGLNILMASPNKAKVATGLAKLKWMVIIDPLQTETLPTYVRALRRVDVNAEFNSVLCRGLLHARFDTETPLTPRRAGQSAEPPKVSA